MREVLLIDPVTANPLELETIQVEHPIVGNASVPSLRNCP
jgi:hypothetical protein